MPDEDALLRERLSLRASSRPLGVPDPGRSLQNRNQVMDLMIGAARFLDIGVKYSLVPGSSRHVSLFDISEIFFDRNITVVFLWKTSLGF